jgi:acetyltransferase
MKPGNMKRMFNPKTVALIGATDKEGSIGNTVMQNLLLSKDRKVFPINPKTAVTHKLTLNKNLLSQ